MLDEIKDILKVSLFCIAVLLIVIFISYAEVKSDEVNWNDGKCKECGCKWKYQDMFHVKNGGEVYIYCDKKGHTIKVHKNYGMP